MTIYVHDGIYKPLEVNAQSFGTKTSPVSICAAEGEKLIIQSEKEVGIYLVNVDNFVRNGKCYGNVIYGISTFGNKAYQEGDGYNLNAGGIYVDGGQKIEINQNIIYNCDIGIEVATTKSTIIYLWAGKSESYSTQNVPKKI